MTRGSIPRPALCLAISAILLPVVLSAEPIRVSGHVWSPDTSHGVAGAQVELLPAWEGYSEAVRRLRDGTEPHPLATAHTDKEGFFEISAPEAGAYRLRVHTEGYLTEELPLVPLVENTDAEAATLTPAEPVEVRVVSGDSKALPGLALKVVEEPEDPRIPGGLHWHVAERGGVTDARGRLALWGRRGEHLKLMAISPAFLGEVAVWRAGSPPLRFLPKPASKLEVRTAEGKPVSGALVRWQSWALGLTGADGRFPLAFPPGSEPLRVESGDGGAGQGTAPPGSKAASLLAIRLEPPRIVEGQVLQQRSPKPVPNALVWTGNRMLGPPVRAGADGKFRLTLSTVEEVSLEAAASGFLHSESQLIPRTSTTPAMLRLEPAARIAGQVVDTAGNPVSQTYMRISMQGFRGMTLSRADGRFQFSGLQFQKSYEIKGFHRDYADGEAKTRTASPGQAAPPVKIVMGSGVTAFGHVVDAAGSPVPGARVTLTSARSKRFPATTNAEGNFEVKAVDTGKLTLRARSTGFSPLSRPVEIPPGTPKFDLGAIEMPAAVVVEGEVTDAHGTPIAGAIVESNLSSFDPFQWAEDLASPPPEARTSPEGRFRLTDLPRATPVQLQIEHEGYIPLKVLGVEAPLQEPLHLEMKTARSLSGRVVGPDGEPVGGATISRVEESHTGGGAMMSETELGLTDAHGSFQVSGFEPGPNDLRVAAEGYATKTVRGVTIPVDRDLQGLEVVLGRGIILQVWVLSADGGPIAGARVNVQPQQPASEPRDMGSIFRMPRMQTDERGACQGELPNPGTYRVSASVDQRTASIVVEARAGTTPVELRLPSGVQASGRVTDAQGQPLARVFLSLAGTRDPSFRQGVMSGEDGAFVFRQVPDGDYRLRAELQGFKPSSEPREVVIAGSDIQDLDLQLEPVTGATVTGHLLGLRPEEILGASVGGSGGEAGFFPEVRVEPDGRYEIKNVGPGDWRFTAVTSSKRMAQQRITIQPGEAGIVLDFEFGKGATLSGMVLVEGSPLSGAVVRVTLASSAGARWQSAATTGTSRSTIYRRVLTSCASPARLEPSTRSSRSRSTATVR
ncbi:MAG TPA: carboxypeptidase regulatory-like domain-containing protein [Thermoanaerobaculia bacterium]|jgi:protocatechuate 3,4-dioxygenase beta subunit|nr:carboxypeptidase regulatory-like domain-containing protein [Thermoanaerobaculia bacterium]